MSKQKLHIADLLKEQCEHWTLAKTNFEGLNKVLVKTFHFDGFHINVQFNPQRITSSTAKVDAKSIEARPCFLCQQNRPQEQEGILWNNRYWILVNPFPIFPQHFTIPSVEHKDQRISGHLHDMLNLAHNMEDYVIFYNGPKCGASAPDHFHFQAGNKNFMPIAEEIMKLESTQLLTSKNGVNTYATDNYLRHVLTLRSKQEAALVEQLEELLKILPVQEQEEEPRVNIHAYYTDNTWVVHLFPRQLHRPSCFFKEGASQILISPASVDLGGVLITPREDDFNKITTSDIVQLYNEVSMHKEEWNALTQKIKTPTLEVGILSAPQIAFEWNNENYTIHYEPHVLKLYKNNVHIGNHTSLSFIPKSENQSFLIKDVVIGVDFHWEQKEDQRFKGALKFIIEKEQVTAINIISIEDYLVSVISSEMSAHSSMELLKAHAITSRSWLLAQLEKSKELQEKGTKYTSEIHTNSEYIKWFDREDHALYDVCADDHCQRYQGITRACTPAVEQAIAETRGQVICYDNKICDARFYKCCGGITERFENCWEPEPHPYLQNIVDFKQRGEPTQLLDISKDEDAEYWIQNHTESFCNTHDAEIIRQVLNEYDQQTPDFYRWKTTLTQEEITQLIPQRIGIDFGAILDLIPVERGPSGRIIKLKIVGTLKTGVIGKELLIRKALSKSHLYSSAFLVEKGIVHKGIPTSFTLVGAGWGHGVGLCQIGAAVMGSKGFTPEEIIMHYFPQTQLKSQYGK